jgi:hypothetical protein
MRVETYRKTLEEYTAALNGLDEVFRALGNEAEAGLMGVEFENPPERLLCYNREIIGIIEKDPCNSAADRAHTAYEFRETLANRRNSAVIRTRETKCHRGLVFGVRHALCCELFRDPGICQHCLAYTCGSPENDVRRFLEM